MDMHKLKADFEQGYKYDELAKKYGISKGTISKYKKKYGWKRSKKQKQKRETNRKRVSEKVSNAKLSKIPSANDKWKKFCLLYLQSYNATQSYLKVYDCSYETARTNGPALLANTRVKKYLDELRAEQSNELYITSTDIIKQQMKIAYANLADYVEIKTIKQRREDIDGNPVEDANGNQIIDTYNEIVAKDPSKIDYSLVKSVHKGKDGLVLELYDKQKALSELMKYLPEARDTTAVDPMVNAVKHSLTNQITDEDIEKGDK